MTMFNHGQGVVKGALVQNSAGCWRGGANLARRGLGAMEERGGGARLLLQDIQAWREKLSRAITFTFPNLKFSLSVILRVLSVLEEGSHDPKVLAMLD